jgi:ATP-dependent helicase/nuclease subunit B
MSAPTLVPTPFGRPAAEALHARVAAAKTGDPLRPVNVVVPTNAVGVSMRRALASGALGPVSAAGTGIAGLTLLTVYRLAELLGAAGLAAEGRRPVSTPLIGAVLRRLLAEEPGIFADVASHPSTEEALVRAYRELSELSEAQLDAVAGTGPRAADVVRLRRQAREALRGGWYEEADLMASAREAVTGGTSVLDDLGTVIVHLPQRLSEPAAALLRALAERTAVEVVAGLTGVEDADGDVLRSLQRLGLAVGADVATRTSAGSHEVPTEVVSVSDAEEEVRTAVERVVAAARAGTPLERIAVLYPSERPYARLLAEALDAAGVPWNGRGVRPLTDRLLGRWLLDLLSLPERGWARSGVLDVLAAGPSRRGSPVAAWERVSREAGVVGGRDGWERPLRRLAEDLRGRATSEEEVADRDPRPWVVTGSRRAAGHAEALAEAVAALQGRLAEAEAAATWSGIARWCREIAAEHLGDAAGWPPDERVAADRVHDALDRLAGLGQVEPAVGLATFRRALELELEQDLGKRGSLGRGLLVGTTTAALGVDLALVVHLGLAEGVFPTRPREDSLLPDADRRAADGDLPLRREHVGVEHRHLLSALAAAGERCVLVHPRGDLRRSVEHPPSRWLLDVVAVLREDGQRALPDPGREHHDWWTHVPSFAARVRRTTSPTTRQEYGLRALAGTGRGAALLDHPLAADDEVLRGAATLVVGRGTPAFTRFDGNLGGLGAAGGLAPATSASRLEAWLACPHAYLLEQVLRVTPVEHPEELLQLDALERGSLVHDVLEGWLKDRLAEGVPGPGEPWSDEARADLLRRAERACDEAQRKGLTGHPLLWRRDRADILADLDRFLAEDDRRRAALGLSPIAAERAFGLDGTPELEIDLGEGRRVRLRGRIDRLDEMGDGGLLVTDYKTGGLSRYSGLGDDAPLGKDGTKLQLPIYALAMRAAEDRAWDPIRVEYWFTSRKGGFKTKGCTLTPEAEEDLTRALRVAVDGIAAGHFPARPPEPAGAWGTPFVECRCCDPDELGTADRFRDWEAVRAAPALARYVAYVEPEEGR